MNNMKKKFWNPFSELTLFEKILWLVSVLSIIVSFLLAGSKDILTIFVSIVGVTSLIFVAKGFVLGEVLTIVFAVIYGIISFYTQYYGEMITYLGMTTPSCLFCIFSWLRHPYKGTKEVTVSIVKPFHIYIIIPLTIVVTIIFYFILSALGNANLIISTLSISTSFAGSSLAFLRSPYYAVVYSVNDIILVVLWLLASFTDSSYIPMVVCFILFLVNDIYGFVNWKRMRLKQNVNSNFDENAINAMAS